MHLVKWWGKPVKEQIGIEESLNNLSFALTKFFGHTCNSLHPSSMTNSNQFKSLQLTIISARLATCGNSLKMVYEPSF